MAEREPAAAISGTQGYAQQAHELVERYEAVPFAEKHQAVAHLFPAAPARVIDIGAGTGADAAWFAARGVPVVAVEPTAALRQPGMALHASPLIEWVDDSLPDLAIVTRRGHCFDLVLLTAVWMHLDATERARAMPTLASLLGPRGVMVMSIRRGPVPEGRRMFEVPAQETVAQAHACGLRAVLNVETASVQAVNRQAGVSWLCLAFERAV